MDNVDGSCSYRFLLDFFSVSVSSKVIVVDDTIKLMKQIRKLVSEIECMVLIK